MGSSIKATRVLRKQGVHRDLHSVPPRAAHRAVALRIAKASSLVGTTATLRSKSRTLRIRQY